MQKSTIKFSLNTLMETQRGIKELLGAQNCSNQDKYFGSPIMISRKKKNMFNSIKERVWKKASKVEGKIYFQRWYRNFTS